MAEEILPQLEDLKSSSEIDAELIEKLIHLTLQFQTIQIELNQLKKMEHEKKIRQEKRARQKSLTKSDRSHISNFCCYCCSDSTIRCWICCNS